MIIPTVTTPRLVMRGHAATDLDDCAALWGDPEVVRYIGGRPFSREECWARVQRYVGHWALLGFGFWAVIEASSGRYVGEVGFGDFRRETTPPIDPLPEGGWVLAPWAHGRGYATEALQAALAWDDGRLARQRTRCLIDNGNDASVRVAARCGYALVGAVSYHGDPAKIYERAPT